MKNDVMYNRNLVHVGTVSSVNISEKKGTFKTPVPKILLLPKVGIRNDAHACFGDVQVSMLKSETVKKFSEKYHRVIMPGEFAENITIEGFENIPINLLDRFIIDKVEMEVTRIGKKCQGKECSIFRTIGDCIMPKEGIFLKVLRRGKIKPGNTVKHIPRVFRFKIITLSDKASAGKYQDAGGHEIQHMLQEYFSKLSRGIKIDYKLLPDDAGKLKREIKKTIRAGCDVIFTTGGTGVGPRDITVDVVSRLCDKTIPGITEFIRMKYGQENSHALLSRSIAGVIKSTLIYTIPGSLKAVREYMAVLLDTMEHLIYVLHGLSH